MKTETKIPGLEGEQFGCTTSSELSLLLKRYLSREDWRDVEQSTGVGFHTIRNLVYQSTTINDKNYLALAELTRLAISKCEDETEDAREAIEILKSKVRA